MARRTSSRLRTGAAAAGSGGGAAGASDGESSGSGGGCPLPPSPGKRKARSPVEDDHGLAAGLANPNPLRSPAFQSPKKRAQGIGERFSAPVDKENDLRLSSSSSSNGFSVPIFGDGGAGGGSGTFRLSAFSAFSQHASPKPGEQSRNGGRRRSREETPATVPSPSNAPCTPRVPTGSVLPFLLAPASVTSSPDLRRKAASRRATRATRANINTNSSSSSSSNSSSGGVGLRRSGDGSSLPQPLISPPRVMPPDDASACSVDAAVTADESSEDPATSTPRKGRYSFRSAAGCAAGGRRVATVTTVTSSSAESMSVASSTDINSGGGGPAGSYFRAVGGGRLGPGGGGGGDTMSDHSPRRSPVHCLTESLQKWDPGSRYTSPADRVGDGEEGVGAAASGAPGVAVGAKEVGASWNGQELRSTLEKERMGRGRRRRHSITSAQDMYPQARFGDHSPISPASSVASVTLEGFDAGTPASSGRPWRSSPRRSEGGGTISGGSGRRASGSSIRGGAGAGGDEGARSAEHFGVVRMESSWSEDETGPSGTVMKLAFSPGRISTDARTPTGGKGFSPAVATAVGAADRGEGGAATANPFTVSRWHHPFSPVKGQRPAGIGESSAASFTAESPAHLSKSGHSVSTEAEGPDLLASPEQPSLHSMRDLMDEGTDDDDDDHGDGNRVALVRRRRGRPRAEVALRTLEMPDAMETEDIQAASGPAAAAADRLGITAVGSASKDVLNPLVSPMVTGKGLGGGEGGGFGTGCTTTCRQWEGPAPLERSSICPHDTPVTAVSSSSATDDSWIRERGKGKGTNWEACSASSGFGVGAGDDTRQDVSGGGLSEENSSGVTLGLSGLADTSSGSEASMSFVKSRPIPDQSAFTSSRFSKVGPHSPLGSASGGGSGGGPATSQAPVCLTPRKSMMRCPPTPQRTPTWDSEDSLLLEGAGSGGRACGGVSAGLNSRSCLRQSKLLASSDDGLSGSAGMAIDIGLANASHEAARRRSRRFEAGTVTDGDGAAASGGREGDRNDASLGGRSGGSGRGGRGRGGRQQGSDGDTNAGSGGSGGNTAEQATRPSSAASSSSGTGVAVGTAGAAAAADSTLGFKHDFVQMGPIGEGGFSVVWKVRAKGTGRLYAIKRSKREFRGRRDRDRCLLEARALQRLGQHPGVLRFERAWQEEGHFCLQTELCELGTLKDFLERLPSRREIPEAAVWQVLQDIGQALKHVHATGLVHLDVKPANLLIGDEGGRLKLADFGMATAYGEGVQGIGDGQEGDTLYMAKELLSSTERLPSADIFSLGLTVYEVATRIELPGDGEDWHAMRDGRAVGLPSSRSQELGTVLRQLMHPDPRQRPTAEALCEHPRVARVTGSSIKSKNKKGTGGKQGATAAGGRAASAATASLERDDYVVSQARAWRTAEAAAMDHPSSGLRTPTGDMSARYIFQQTG